MSEQQQGRDSVWKESVGQAQKLTFSGRKPGTSEAWTPAAQAIKRDPVGRRESSWPLLQEQCTGSPLPASWGSVSKYDGGSECAVSPVFVSSCHFP